MYSRCAVFCLISIHAVLAHGCSRKYLGSAIWRHLFGFQISCHSCYILLYIYTKERNSCLDFRTVTVSVKKSSSGSVLTELDSTHSGYALFAVIRHNFRGSYIIVSYSNIPFVVFNTKVRNVHCTAHMFSLIYRDVNTCIHTTCFSVQC